MTSTILFDSIFLGFAITQLMFLVWRVFKGGLPERMGEINTTSLFLVRYAGIGLIILWPLLAFIRVYTYIDYTDAVWIWTSKLFGDNWGWHWAYPVLFLLATQVFWFKKVASSMTLRLIISVAILFILSYNRFVIVMVSQHREYVNQPYYWESLFYDGFWLELLFKLGIFFILVSLKIYIGKVITVDSNKAK